MKYDKIIINGAIVSPNGKYKADIGINGDKIVSIAQDLSMNEADEVIDASGMYILPGAIDGHLHFSVPEFPERESLEQATQACAIGGITTGICMSSELAINIEGYHEIQKQFAGKAYVDYGIHGYLKADNAYLAESLWQNTEMCALKMYTTYGCQCHDEELWEVFEAGKKCGGMSIIHAENDGLIKLFTRRLQEQGRKDIMAHVESRPAIVELEAVRRCILFVEKTGSQAVIAHVSTAEALEEIHSAQQRGVHIWAESCPHLLTFVQEDLLEYGPYLAFTPVMRDEKNRMKMWELFRKGYISTIGSDHCPCEREKKEASKDDVWKTFNGISGLEAFMPVLLDGVNKGLVSLERVVEVTSRNPARLYGLYPQKGELLPGFDADILLVDMEKEKTLEEKDLKVKCGWSPYVGRKLKGWPVLTMVRGQVVARDGEIVGEVGHGKQALRKGSFDPDLM